MSAIQASTNYFPDKMSRNPRHQPQTHMGDIDRFNMTFPNSIRERAAHIILEVFLTELLRVRGKQVHIRRESACAIEDNNQWASIKVINHF